MKIGVIGWDKIYGSIDYNLQLGSDLEEMAPSGEVREAQDGLNYIEKMVFFTIELTTKKIASYHIDSGKMMRFSILGTGMILDGKWTTFHAFNFRNNCFTVDGLVCAVNIQDGKLKWKIDLLKEFHL